MSIHSAMPCLMRAWQANEHALRSWLMHHLHDCMLSEDLLQDVFIKAMRQGERFCNLENARAWLFEVTRNTLADQLRRARDTVELPEEMIAESYETPTIDNLAACLPRVLSELSGEDRQAITLCDIEGMTQADFAKLLGISLPAAKSRVQRARQRLKAQLSAACKVRLDDQGKVCCFTPREALPVMEE